MTVLKALLWHCSGNFAFEVAVVLMIADITSQYPALVLMSLP